MTTPTARPVADIFEEVAWLGPIADVTARCAFGDEVVQERRVLGRDGRRRSSSTR